MTQEEKAKAYDIALAKIKMLLGTGSNCSREELEYVFPELKESKDERIRNLIYCLIRDRSDSKKLLEHNGVSVDEALAWLEKQGQNPAWSEEDKNMLEWVIGYLENKMLNTPISEERTACKNAVAWLEEKLKGEQKPVDKVEPKFHEGEWIINNEHNNVAKVLEINNEQYRLDYCDTVGTISIALIDNNYHLWTIQDAKDGDVLCDYHEECDNPLIFILKKFEHVNFGLVTPSDYSSYCFITTNDRQMFKKGRYHHEHNIKPATKKQRDLLFQKMKETGYKWDAEKKELKKIEYKPAVWSIFDYRTWQYIVSDVLTKKDGIGQYLDDGTCKNIAKYMQEEWSKKLSTEQKSTWCKEDLVRIENCISLIGKTGDGEVKWLKDLIERAQPQSQWKPSDEQIIALRWVLNNIPYNKHKEEISGLLDQIKEL